MWLYSIRTYSYSMQSYHTYHHLMYLLYIKPTMQSSRVSTRHVHDSLQIHVCMLGMHMPSLNYACMQIISQGQWNKLYKHVHVLSCNPPGDTRHKSC